MWLFSNQLHFISVPELFFFSYRMAFSLQNSYNTLNWRSNAFHFLITQHIKCSYCINVDKFSQVVVTILQNKFSLVRTYVTATTTRIIIICCMVCISVCMYVAAATPLKRPAILPNWIITQGMTNMPPLVLCSCNKHHNYPHPTLILQPQYTDLLYTIPC